MQINGLQRAVGHTARERAHAILEAWNDLTEWEAECFLEFAAAELRAGMPLPTFSSHLIEARAWADFAGPVECEAYALAGFERMAPGRQSAFLAHVGRRAAA